MASEKRLIDANWILGEIEHDLGCYEIGKMTEDDALYVELRDIIKMVCAAPTVDAVEVVHGQWEQVQRWATKAKYRCSICGREIMSAVKVNIEKYPYCHCGAKMDGDWNG